MLKDKIHSDEFQSDHKQNQKDFTRERKLTFAKIVVIMMRKSVKSLQNILNEAQKEISVLLKNDEETITGSAYTQARKKLNYTAFIELSDMSRDVFYEDGEYQRFKEYRLLAIDGSIVTLPNTDEIKKEFGVMYVKNQDANFSKEITQARASTLYDVLNHITIDARLDKKAIDERTQAHNHLQKTKKGDLVIFDRGYPAYTLFTSIIHSDQSDFLMRIRKNSFKDTAYLFNPACKDDDLIITLRPSTEALLSTIKAQGLPQSIKVRFIRVVLDNGDIEVLATSVLDNTLLTTKDFKLLYHLRWEIETHYDVIKNRLNLENFTGLSALSVKQDFFATIFISNYESVVTYESNQELQDKDTIHQQKVNRSVSFNTIKNYCFDLFYSEQDIAILLEKMEKLFITNTTLVRNNRSSPRYDYEKTKHLRNALNYHKRRKKIVF